MMDYRAEIERDAETGAARLFVAFGDRLWNSALKLCRNPTDAEDLTLKTFEHAIRNIRKYDPRRPVFPWLCAVLANLYRMDLRGKARNSLEFMAEVPEVTDTVPDPAETLSMEADARAVRKSVAALPRADRLMVVLRYFDGLTVPEIARALALPEGTVKRRLHCAKARLRQILRERFAVCRHREK